MAGIFLSADLVSASVFAQHKKIKKFWAFCFWCFNIFFMKNTQYDFDKETNKDFLREAGKMLQEEVIQLRIEVAQLRLQQIQDEEIKTKLTGELLV